MRAAPSPACGVIVASFGQKVSRKQASTIRFSSARCRGKFGQMGRTPCRSARGKGPVRAGLLVDPFRRFLLDGQRVAASWRHRRDATSLVFPANSQPVTYVFGGRDFPSTTVLTRYFPDQPGDLVGTTPDGTYRLLVGLYLPETGRRLPLLDSMGKMAGDHAVIEGVVIERAPGG